MNATIPISFVLHLLSSSSLPPTSSIFPPQSFSISGKFFNKETGNFKLNSVKVLDQIKKNIFRDSGNLKSGSGSIARDKDKAIEYMDSYNKIKKALVKNDPEDYAKAIDFYGPEAKSLENLKKLKPYS